MAAQDLKHIYTTDEIVESIQYFHQVEVQVIVKGAVIGIDGYKLEFKEVDPDYSQKMMIHFVHVQLLLKYYKDNNTPCSCAGNFPLIVPHEKAGRFLAQKVIWNDQKRLWEEIK